MIYQNTPLLDGNENLYVQECLKTNWISSSGKFLKQFEEKFSNYCGVDHGIACCNGTAALHLAIQALDVKPGDEILVPCFTLIADANMVLLSGAKPVFVDVHPVTYCIDPEKIKEKITAKTKAIIAVHMYGHPCDMDAINDIALKNNIKVIEDAAQAHGTEYKNKKAGSLADIGCFSFYATKTLTTGEGGMVVTNDTILAEKVKKMRSHGFEGGDRDYIHKVFGFNYRLTNIQAAIGVAQCEKVEEKIIRKREIAKLYNSFLKDCKFLILPQEQSYAKNTYWNYFVVVDKSSSFDRNSIKEKLCEKGIQTRLPFQPLNNQPVYKNILLMENLDTNEHYPVSNLLSECGLCLPSGLGLSNEEIFTISQNLLNIFK